tara:strand:- start:1412 stop:1813 length:402 start_codon:yes stop_codon:yes gene_type:complete
VTTKINIEKLNIYYDYECPVCRNFIKYYRLKNDFPNIKLINARDDEYKHKIKNFYEKGYDINVGMIVELNNEIYWGDKAVNIMSLISNKSSLFNKINFLFFSKPFLASLLYPLMVFGRNILLMILRVKKIKIF